MCDSVFLETERLVKLLKLLFGSICVEVVAIGLNVKEVHMIQNVVTFGSISATTTVCVLLPFVFAFDFSMYLTL